MKGVWQMTRGTTPKLKFTIPFRTDLIEVGYVTFNQYGKTVLEKDNSTWNMTGYEVAIDLTQKETLLFGDDEPVEIQVAIRQEDGTVFRSMIAKSHISRILKDAEI